MIKKPKYTLEEGPQGIEISIPIYKEPRDIIIQIIHLSVLMYCDIVLLLNPEIEISFDNVFTLFPFIIILFYIICIILLIGIIWRFIGKEFIIIYQDQLIIENSLWSYLFSKKYILHKVKNMKISQKPQTLWRFPFLQFYRHIETKCLEFDYYYSKVTFADGLDIRNQKNLLKEIKNRFPDLVQQ